MLSIVNTAYFTWNGGQSSASCTIKKRRIIMACKPCITVSAVDITTDGDITTITVADGALQSVVGTCKADVNICINTSFDTCRECTRIVVTDTHSTFNVAKCNQYWRPTRLICNSVICTEYKNDPELLVFKGGKH